MKNLDAINGDEEKILMKVNRNKGDKRKRVKLKIGDEIRSIIYISIYYLTNMGQFNIEAFVNQNKITVDEYVKYTIKSNERVRLTNLSFENFVIRQGPFTSSLAKPLLSMANLSK